MNERILAIDTTREFGSLALSEGEALVEEVLLHSKTGFGHILYDHLARLLERHGWGVAEIDCFAATAGPGSFTGVRIGLACVKGLAEATGKRVVPVSNLEALAWFGTAPLRAPVIDARRGEIYGALYDADLKLVAAETVTKLPAWLASLPQGEIEFISTDLTDLRSALAERRFENARITAAPQALASAVARIARRCFQQGASLDPDQVDANYIRRSDAELVSGRLLPVEKG